MFQGHWNYSSNSTRQKKMKTNKQNTVKKKSKQTPKKQKKHKAYKGQRKEYELVVANWSRKGLKNSQRKELPKPVQMLITKYAYETPKSKEHSKDPFASVYGDSAESPWRAYYNEHHDRNGKYIGRYGRG